jgi:hypothetical protein
MRRSCRFVTRPSREDGVRKIRTDGLRLEERRPNDRLSLTLHRNVRTTRRVVCDHHEPCSAEAESQNSDMFCPYVLTDSQRTALRMLSGSPSGYGLLTMTARGVAIEVLQDLIRMGLATTERKAFGRRGIKIAHLRITKAGRRAIAE